MLSKNMNEKLNAQITHEFYSSYMYRQMASWFDASGLKILHQRFLTQANEEQMHATKLIDYLQKAGGTLRLGAIEAPPCEYDGVADVLARTYKHEQGVTKKIHQLVAQAEKDEDYSTRSYLQWYIDEQVEEESSFSDMLQLAKLAGDNLLALEDRIEKLMTAAKKAAAGAAAGA